MVPSEPFRTPPAIDLDERLARLLPLTTLEALQSLPRHMPIPTLLHPPRAIATRFGNVYAQCFAQCNAALDSNCPATQQNAGLCLYFCPALLLWKDVAADVSNRVSLKVYRERIILAEQGAWHTLAIALKIACEAKLAKEADRKSASKITPSLEHTFEAACAKVRGNCLRSAAQLLLGDGAPPPGPATISATKLLFLTNPDDAETAALRQLATPFLRSTAGAAVAGKLRAKHIIHRVGLLRAAAQPGPSGSRNTHIKACRTSTTAMDTQLVCCNYPTQRGRHLP